MNPQDPSPSHLADVLGDLIERLRDPRITLGGSIEAKEIKANNVVSGLQIVIPQPPSPTSPSSLLWTITLRPNPYFIGCEDLLTTIANAFQTSKGAATPQALSGLGGVGKTQIALEYAYRFVADYQFVFWAQAAIRDTLIADYVTFATLLSLPEKDEQDQFKTVQAVKQWLTTHDKWLLVLDNADELVIARDFLPASPTGHILLTTRAEITAPLAQRIEVNTLPTDTAALFLLRRAGLLTLEQQLDQASPADQTLAYHLCTELGGLALALDQAGAYILEEGISLSSYLPNYETSQAQLLNYRGGDLVEDHPDSVMKTLFLSFQLVQQRNPTAANLLRLCAFLAPNAIPEELFTQKIATSDSLLGLMKSDPQEFNTALKALRAYSLVRRNLNNQTLSIHRLVQAVLKDQMDEQDKKLWAQRAVRAVEAAFPEVEYQTWPQCDRLLPHALLCAELIAQEQMNTPEVTHLLNQTGYYLNQRARYMEAEPLLKRALAIHEQQLGPQHPDTANSLNDLAFLYQDQGKAGQAEPLYQRALAIREQQLGPDHSDTATSLNNLANLYQDQGKAEQAEPLLKRALAIHEQQVGPQHPHTAGSLISLAALYSNQSKYEQAEPLLVRALAIYEQQLGAQHPHTAQSLNNLATLYQAQGKDEQAEPLFQRALVIFEKALPPDHLHTATTLENYAILLRKTNRLLEAQTLELEAFITMKGDNPAHDYAVRRRVVETSVFVLGKLAQGTSAQGAPGTAHLLHCTVPVGEGDTTIAMLPVFTRLEHVVTAVQMNPAWQLLHVLQMEGSVVLGDLEEGEWLGINAWSRHEFKLPPTASTNLPPAR